MRFTKCAVPGWLQAFLTRPLFSHPKMVTLAERSTNNVLLPTSCFFLGERRGGGGRRQLFVKMSRTTARSREVLIILSLSVVIIPHHRCLEADMAWCPVASDGRMPTIFRYWLAVKAALTSHCGCAKSWSRCSGLVARGVPMFSVMKFQHPRSIAVERANGYLAFDSSRGRSLRAVATVGGRWSLSMGTSCSWHSAAVVLSRSLMPASTLRERPTWFQESLGQPCARNRQHCVGIICLLRSNWSPRWLDVCTCTDASEKGVVREGCRELASEVERVLELTRFRSSSRSIGARSRALRCIAADAALRDSRSDEGEVSRARRESRPEFPEVSLQLLDPSEWKLAAFGGFFREENIIIIEVLSILHAVRYAENRCPPVRFLIISDNLALLLALFKGCSNNLHCFQSCVESLHLVSEQDFSCRSGGYLRN